MRNDLQFIGNKKLLDLPKTAFLSSDKFSSGSVLKSYDWAAEMKRQNQCVISGFQSRLERDVFDILIKGTQPIIMVLARSIYDKPPAKLKANIDSGRLLIISQFESGLIRITRELAYQRNRLILDLADSVVIAHIHSGGMLEKLIKSYKKETTVLDG